MHDLTKNTLFGKNRFFHSSNRFFHSFFTVNKGFSQLFHSKTGFSTGKTVENPVLIIAKCVIRGSR